MMRRAIKISIVVGIVRRLNSGVKRADNKGRVLISSFKGKDVF